MAGRPSELMYVETPLLLLLILSRLLSKPQPLALGCGLVFQMHTCIFVRTFQIRYLLYFN